MTPLEEIRAAEARMHITLTNRQRGVVERWLESGVDPETVYASGVAYARKLYESVLAAR